MHVLVEEGGGAFGFGSGFGRHPGRDPSVSRCARPKAWGAKEAPGLPDTWPLHMGAANVVVRPRIWYALGIDPAISRVLSACPTARPTVTREGGRWQAGAWGREMAGEQEPARGVKIPRGGRAFNFVCGGVDTALWLDGPRKRGSIDAPPPQILPRLTLGPQWNWDFWNQRAKGFSHNSCFSAVCVRQLTAANPRPDTNLGAMGVQHPDAALLLQQLCSRLPAAACVLQQQQLLSCCSKMAAALCSLRHLRLSCCSCFAAAVFLLQLSAATPGQVPI